VSPRFCKTFCVAITATTPPAKPLNHMAENDSSCNSPRLSSTRDNNAARIIQPSAGNSVAYANYQVSAIRIKKYCATEDSFERYLGSNRNSHHPFRICSHHVFRSLTVWSRNSVAWNKKNVNLHHSDNPKGRFTPTQCVALWWRAVPLGATTHCTAAQPQHIRCE